MDIYLGSHVNENSYWFALSTAFHYGAKIACLNIFHDRQNRHGYPDEPKKLFKKLVKQKPRIEKLYRQGALTRQEWYLLFPLDHRTDSKAFNIGMLMALVHHLVLPPPDNLGAGGNSQGFLLVRLRQFKDKLGHMKGTQVMSREVFELEWRNLCRILAALGFNPEYLEPIYSALGDHAFRLYIKDARDPANLAFEEAKILYIRKTMREIRSFYKKHLSNINVMLSTTSYQQVGYLHRQAQALKAPMRELEDDYTALTYKDYVSPLPFLYNAAQIKHEILRNDVALDVEIDRYNEAVDVENMRITKLIHDTMDKRMREKFHHHLQYDRNDHSKTMQSAAQVGWLRRNTMVTVSSSKSRPTILSQDGNNNIFKSAVTVGDY